MNLDATQRDALSEIANIGVSRAAKQLSLLLDDAIDMRVPDLRIAELKDVCALLPEAHCDASLMTVYQGLDGYISGRAMLMFHSEESRALAQALVGNVPPIDGQDMRAFEHEAVMEIGNIIISSCISVVADILGREIILTVPSYGEDTLPNLLRQDWHHGASADMRVMVMHATLRAAHRDVNGTLLIVLTLQSMQALLDQVSHLVATHQSRLDGATAD